MVSQIKRKHSWTGVPARTLIGAVVVLLPLFAFMTVASINRQQEKSTQLLLEKGAALIRSFEAGTRTGMHRSGFRLQQLLTETAQQPDIVHLLVADAAGEIIAHNDLDQIGVSLDGKIDLKKISNTKDLRWRILENPDGTSVFEVYRRFTPSERPAGWQHGGGMMRRRMKRLSDADHQFRRPLDNSPKIIFVGLDMTAIKEAHRTDIRHAVFMGLILLLVGLAGITLLFLFQSYRSTKASLSRIKAFSDNVVANMPIGLIALDDQQRIAAINHAAESLMQLSFREAIGKTAEQILPTELCDEINRQQIEHRVFEKEIDCTVGKGQALVLEVGASRIMDENGISLGDVILFRDQTEVRALRRELERSRRLASVGRLAAGVAHEIRNPLSSIKGFATYFKQRYQDVPQDQQTADIMIQEVDRLNRVVSRLLEFARPVNVSLQPVSVRDLVVDSLKLIQQSTQDHQIEIQDHYSTTTDRIDTDPDCIRQVLLNLYLNAIDSMQPGGCLRVEVADSAAKDALYLKIMDTGIGIAQKDLSKIFDPYYTTKSSGTGLGLAIAHNIVEAIGGSIEVESKPAQGTTFTLILPIIDHRQSQAT